MKHLLITAVSLISTACGNADDINPNTEAIVTAMVSSEESEEDASGNIIMNRAKESASKTPRDGGVAPALLAITIASPLCGHNNEAAQVALAMQLAESWNGTPLCPRPHGKTPAKQ